MKALLSQRKVLAILMGHALLEEYGHFPTSPTFFPAHLGVSQTTSPPAQI